MISLSVILVLQLSIFSLASCASPSATVGFKPTGSEPPKARRIGDNDNRINNEHRTEPGRAEVSVDAVKISGVETLGSLSIPLGYSLQGGHKLRENWRKQQRRLAVQDFRVVRDGGDYINTLGNTPVQDWTIGQWIVFLLLLSVVSSLLSCLCAMCCGRRGGGRRYSYYRY